MQVVGVCVCVDKMATHESIEKEVKSHISLLKDKKRITKKDVINHEHSFPVKNNVLRTERQRNLT